MLPAVKPPSVPENCQELVSCSAGFCLLRFCLHIFSPKCIDKLYSLIVLFHVMLSEIGDRIL